MDFIEFIVVFLSFLSELSFGVIKEEISLSPATWPREEFQRLETISLRKNPRPKPLAFSDVEGLVAGTTSALAVHAGADALRKGGNAMDACIATAMAEIPLTAGAKVSFAGVTNILYYHHVTGRVHNLDAGWKIPRHRNQNQVPSLETLGDSVLVPGLLAGMFEAAEFSKFPLSKLLEPAFFFADQGFKMTHSLSKMIKKYYNKQTLLRTDKGFKIFTNPQTNKPYEPTELFRQPQLAKFIRNVQKNGKNYFYRGKWTKKMLSMLRAHGGHMTINDMAYYEAQWIEPASTTYNGYHATTTGSDWGGVELIEMLKMMELAGMAQTNDTYLTNATKLLSLISISRYSQFVSAYSHANPEAWGTLHEYFNIDASRKGRMSNASAKLIWNHLGNQEGLDMVHELMTELLTSIPDFDRHRENRRGFSGIVAMDEEGNICSMAHTANTRPWGTGLFVQGVALPHSGAVFRDFVACGQPGSRIPSGLQPVLIFKKNAKKKYSSLSRGNLHRKEKSHEEQKNQEILTKHQELNDSLLDEASPKPTKKRPRILLSDILRKGKIKLLKALSFIRGQSRHRIDDSTFLDPENGGKKIELNSSISFVEENQKQRQENRTEYHAENDTLQRELTRKMNETKDEIESEWEKEWETNWERELENELESEEEEKEIEIEYDKWEEDEWENEWEKEPFEFEEDGIENKNENENTGSEDQEEPETIGGLFDEIELNSNFGRNDSNKTSEKDSTPRYVVKSWFRNLVRRLLQREKKKIVSAQIILENKRKRRKRELVPVAALSVIGQSAAEAILQYINNLLDNRMNAKQASDTPMFFSSTPGSLRQDVRLERFSFDQDVIDGVRSHGQNISEVIHKVGRVITGYGAVLTVKDKKVYGCSHSDSEGFAEGH